MRARRRGRVRRLGHLQERGPGARARARSCARPRTGTTPARCSRASRGLGERDGRHRDGDARRARAAREPGLVSGRARPCTSRSASRRPIPSGCARRCARSRSRRSSPHVGGELFASHLPLLLDADARRRTARCSVTSRAATRTSRAFDGGTPTLAVFQARTPTSRRAGTRRTPNVPTWNYVAVHASGPLVRIEEEDRVLALLARTAAAFEPREGGWTPDVVPATSSASSLPRSSPSSCRSSGSRASASSRRTRAAPTGAA